MLNAPRIPGLGQAPLGAYQFQSSWTLQRLPGRRPVSPKQLQSLFLRRQVGLPASFFNSSHPNQSNLYGSSKGALALLLLMDKIHSAPVVGMPETPSIPGDTTYQLASHTRAGHEYLRACPATPGTRHETLSQGFSPQECAIFPQKYDVNKYTHYFHLPKPPAKK